MADTTLEANATRMLLAPDFAVDHERSEFIDGVWIEKPMGTEDHSEIEFRLVALLRKKFRHVGRAILELTIRFGEDILIPDVIVRPAGQEIPILCVEARSPGQRLSTLITKCELYAQRGVPHCWIIDPDGSSWQFSSTAGLTPVVDGKLRAGPIEIQIEELLKDDEDL